MIIWFHLITQQIMDTDGNYKPISWEIHRGVTNYFEKLPTISPEIDNNIFTAVILTTWFIYVLFRLVEYLVWKIEPNNVKNFLEKTEKKINDVAYFNLRFSSKTY